VQNEIHPYYQEREVVRWMQKRGIIVEGWYPLGGRGYNRELLSEPVIQQIADRHGKSLVQTILRWDLQNGVVVIPGSQNPDHQKENISIFDFQLTREEMNAIDALNRDEKHDWY
jgi:diketogulonate reductase-like aldo/keto reductase